MGKPTGFMEFNRELPGKKQVEERILDYKEFYLPFSNKKVEQQAARCMDCGTPFCHKGCPLGNIIPEFNDMVYHKNYKEAYNILYTTNNFPEFTGRICPAPCEDSCVLGINEPPVTIEQMEKTIIENAYNLGYVQPYIPLFRTGFKVAVIGSGPSGLAAAVQLNKVGHLVTVYERADRIGGLLRYGIPDFKLDKSVIDRRMEIMRQEGIVFHTNAYIGENIPTQQILNEFDAIVLACGSTIPRDLDIPGRELKGVHFAMDFLRQNNKRVAGDSIPKEEEIVSTDKHVVVIGGGDTGSDCVGTSKRHGAKSITQVEVMPKPPMERAASNPWPQYRQVLRTSTSHEEGCDRHWSILTKEFMGDAQGNVTSLRIADVKWEGRNMVEIPNTERVIPCERAYLAIGFLHTEHKKLVTELGVELDQRGNIKDSGYQTTNPKVFTAGDARRGQSLVVWAISEGRECARALDSYLMKTESVLSSKNKSVTELR